ncbi:NADAR family protein [Paenibacillus silvae]|uniref:NADAR family protein n=1 Tax=Paenibacillus silvae TaxID=1325358 RepID=UPI002005D981|nr:NADAR family protein [Paenibacillus silvae]MCK6078548.1 NADAR family protein [Paenibacillus silvae]MCK6152868.1 NADAR family protein [Paenibacillus silvae]MCK6271320.1 NADAR family protein [Paenibacillus silvae]
MEKFTFFWHTASPVSQWHPADFIVNGLQYTSAEQYMMHQKALLFGDLKIAEQIMSTNSASVQKKLGRQVKGFDQTVWEAECQRIVYEGNQAKFTQNEELLEALLATRGTTLVEASPDDRIWGVGLAEDNPRIRNRSTWRGTNWLGEILTRLREEIGDA